MHCQSYARKQSHCTVTIMIIDKIWKLTQLLYKVYVVIQAFAFTETKHQKSAIEMRYNTHMYFCFYIFFRNSFTLLRFYFTCRELFEITTFALLCHTVSFELLSRIAFHWPDASDETDYVKSINIVRIALFPIYWIGQSSKYMKYLYRGSIDWC